VSHPGRQEARDPSAAHREVRRHARRSPEALPMRTGRSVVAALVAVLVLVATLGACSGDKTPGGTVGRGQATTTSADGSPGATGADGCVVSGQGPPSATLSATYATALAFAPDGRLFWAERAGTVRVYQDGQAKEFATVPTVTTEP